jgi:Zinc finger, C2H2 type
MSDETSSGFKCDQCGISFTTQQDKEEHMKLEHNEGREPTGVS